MTEEPRVRRPKLAHVAMAAGVSLGTASDALRGKGRMSEDVRRRVRDAAEGLGYRPNANARILALGHSTIVALVAHSVDSPAAPRIYWPRLQAAFTERLLEQGMVATTMTLDDLHSLDGLPFDLIVYAGWSLTTDVPAEIRSHYRVLDLGIIGDTALARNLRKQFEHALWAGLNELIAAGCNNPGLICSGGANSASASAYRSWCGVRAQQPVILDADDAFIAEKLASEMSAGTDGLLAVLTDVKWLDDLVERVRPQRVAPLQIVAFGPEVDHASRATVVRTVQIDGEALGAQIADAAVAFLAGQRPSALNLQFLLEGQPLVTKPRL